MGEKEILQKAVEKAVQNGFNFWGGEVDKWAVIGSLEPYLSIFYWRRTMKSFDADYTYEVKYVFDQVLFDHTFAKALFKGRPDKDDFEAWEYHLMELALTEPHKRIQCLKEFL